MAGQYTAKVKYIGDSPYEYYKWRVSLLLDGIEVDYNKSDWHWWAVLWSHFAAFSHRNKQRTKERDRARGDKEYEL